MRFKNVCSELQASPKHWCVTGCAGFIGSHLIETLLKLNQTVVGIDNFVTGKRENLDSVKSAVGDSAWRNFRFFEGDVCDSELLKSALVGVHLLLHQAALGSVPRSLGNPRASHIANVDGFLEVLIAARDAKVEKLVYASSSSVYGDSDRLPMVEQSLGRVLSPYAATKLIDEIYAGVFSRCYDLPTVGLRYFNVFGPRQDPNGAYAAVIPRWIDALVKGKECVVFGDGKTTRAFSYVENVVHANILAATAPVRDVVLNVAGEEGTDLKQLFDMIAQALGIDAAPTYAPFRPGDIRHSLANISASRESLGYQPAVSVRDGIVRTVDWFRNKHSTES